MNKQTKKLNKFCIKALIVKNTSVIVIKAGPVSRFLRVGDPSYNLGKPIHQAQITGAGFDEPMSQV